MFCHLAKKVWVGKPSLSGLERGTLLPKFLSPHQGARTLGNRNTKAVYYFLWLTVLKWENKNVSSIILFLYSWFDLEPRKLTCGINDTWGQTWVCGEKWDQTAGLYTNNPLAVLTSSLSALSPPCPPQGQESIKYFLSVGQDGGRVGNAVVCTTGLVKGAGLVALRRWLSWQLQNQEAGCLLATVCSTKSLFSFPQAGQKNIPSQIDTDADSQALTDTEKFKSHIARGKFLLTALDDPGHWNLICLLLTFLQHLQSEEAANTLMSTENSLPGIKELFLDLFTCTYIPSWNTGPGNCPCHDSVVSVRLTPSLSRRTLGGLATCGRAYFMTSLPVVVRPEPAALPFHEYPGLAQDRKQTETSWVRVIATQNSTGKLKAFWTYFNKQNNKEYQLAAWPVWRPVSASGHRCAEALTRPLCWGSGPSCPFTGLFRSQTTGWAERGRIQKLPTHTFLAKRQSTRRLCDWSKNIQPDPGRAWNPGLLKAD